MRTASMSFSDSSSGAVDYYTHRRGDGTHDLFENTTPVESP